jgi:hypothetical protein
MQKKQKKKQKKKAAKVAAKPKKARKKRGIVKITRTASLPADRDLG